MSICVIDALFALAISDTMSLNLSTFVTSAGGSTMRQDLRLLSANTIKTPSVAKSATWLDPGAVGLVGVNIRALCTKILQQKIRCVSPFGGTDV
jgi:hypothetical protein